MIQVTPQLIEKYHLGQCSAAEREAVKEWLRSEDMEAVAVPPLPDGSDEEERMWQTLASRLPDDVQRAGISLPHKKKRPALKVVALSLVFASIVCFVVGYIGSRIEPESLLLKTADIPNGKKATVTLTDGTVVHLNGGSQLQYPEQFATSHRTVVLRGEAFFEVASDEKRPFAVETAQTYTEVLGTAFNLSAYEGEATALAVQSGKVRFSTAGGQHTGVFSGGQGAALGKDETFTRLEKIPSGRFDWKENRLVFNNHTLASIAATLQRWYGITIKVNNPQLQQRTFTGAFDNPSLLSLMKNLAFVMQFEYRINGSQITIY